MDCTVKEREGPLYRIRYSIRVLSAMRSRQQGLSFMQGHGFCVPDSDEQLSASDTETSLLQHKQVLQKGFLLLLLLPNSGIVSVNACVLDFV